MMVGVLGQYMYPLRRCFPMKVAGVGIQAGFCWRGEAPLMVLEMGYLSRSGYPVSDNIR